MTLSNDARFSDGAAYDLMMGNWTRLAGNIFLEWLAAPTGLRWADIGCGSGAFTELIIGHCAPAAVAGIDPAVAQLSFARGRPGAKSATFELGDAMSLPFADKSFDAAVMALVIFFVPDPDKGVGEMVRVVRPGGLIAAYAWDASRGGAPYEVVWDEMDKLGAPPKRPPSVDSSRMEMLRKLWIDAGITAVETKEIVVSRTFTNFDEFWSITTGGNLGTQIAEMALPDQERLKERVRLRLPVEASGRITYSAKANAVKGRKPA